MTEIRPDAIERSRSAGVGDGRSDLEVGMLFAIRAAQLPEPVTELHFDWCCEHREADHEPEAHDPPRVVHLPAVCWACMRSAPGYWSRLLYGHDFRHGRDWRFDFAWPAVKVAIEVEGGTFSEGRHTQGEGFEEDCEKYAEAAIAGWRVLRVTGAMVDDGRALDYLERLLKAKGAA